MSKSIESNKHLKKFYSKRPHYNAWLQYNKRAKASVDGEYLNYLDYLENIKGLSKEEIEKIKQAIENAKHQSVEPYDESIPNVKIQFKITIKDKYLEKFLESVKNKYGTASMMNIEKYKEDMVCQFLTTI